MAQKIDETLTQAATTQTSKKKRRRQPMWIQDQQKQQIQADSQPSTHPQQQPSTNHRLIMAASKHPKMSTRPLPIWAPLPESLSISVYNQEVLEVLEINYNYIFSFPLGK